MAKFTRAQAAKWNAQLSNGFQLDLYTLMLNGDKEGAKRFPMNDGKILEAKLEYQAVYEHYCCIGYQPVLHLQLWTQGYTGDMMISTGFGYSKEIGEPQTKKLYKVLCQLSGTITDDYIMQLASENIAALKNARVL